MLNIVDISQTGEILMDIPRETTFKNIIFI
jgi:hypothetical protein